MDEKKEIQKTEHKPQPKFLHGLIVILITIGIIAFSLIVAEVDGIHVALFLATCVAVLMALIIGFKWSDLENMMIESIHKSVQSIMILLVIGMLIGVWMLSGVVPAMIYYGLQIMRPSFFLAAVMIICSISSVATGSSWSTAASMGIAFLTSESSSEISPSYLFVLKITERE